MCRAELVMVLVSLLAVTTLGQALTRQVGAGSVRDTEKYPICISDSDCDNISEKTGEGHLCFQYMCYPHSSRNKDHPYRLCKKGSECRALTAREGGDGGDGECVIHHDRRRGIKGICLPPSDLAVCSDHSDCSGGKKCISSHCGDPEYFTALQEMTCNNNEFCQEMLTGDHCCFDIRGGLMGWRGGDPDWGKKCCDNKVAPVKRPPDNISRDQLDRLNNKISVHYKRFQLDQTICKGLKYEMMMKLNACMAFTTTTTTTTTTTSTTTKKTIRQTTPKTSAASRHILNGIVFTIFVGIISAS